MGPDCGPQDNAIHPLGNRRGVAYARLRKVCERSVRLLEFDKPNETIAHDICLRKVKGLRSAHLKLGVSVRVKIITTTDNLLGYGEFIMRWLAIACTLGMLTTSALTAKAAVEAYPNSLPNRTLAESIGQPVFDLDGTFVGKVRGITDADGEPSAIVTPSATFSSRGYLLLPGGDMGPRADGGWLVALTNYSVANLVPYRPGEPVPLYE